jgi:hypothetical protein
MNCSKTPENQANLQNGQGGKGEGGIRTCPRLVRIRIGRSRFGDQKHDTDLLNKGEICVTYCGISLLIASAPFPAPFASQPQFGQIVSKYDPDLTAVPSRCGLRVGVGWAALPI